MTAVWTDLSRRSRRFRPNTPAGWVLFAALATLIVVAIAGAALAPYDPLKVSMAERLRPPSGTHLFGTDELGRDVLSRTLAGTGVALQTAVTILVIAILTGVVLGLVAGYYGGLVDEALMRIADVFIAFPALVLAMAIAAALGPSLANATIALAVVWWPTYARLVRGQVLSIRETEYVIAARTMGARDARILRDHVLPAIAAPVLVYAATDFGQALLTSAALSFIGLGVQPPAPEWGSMIALGRAHLLDSWWMSTFPGLAILMTVAVSNRSSIAVRSSVGSAPT